MDKLRAITFFCRIVETSSFTAAARDLGVSQPLLSKEISNLEQDLQFPLLTRSRRRISLTEAGERYYRRCRQLLIDMEEAEATARETRITAKGTLRVGIHPVFQISLCQRLHEFAKENPEVTVQIAHRNSPAALTEEGLDVVLRVGPAPERGFAARQLGTTALLVCAAPEYLKRHGRPSQPDDLKHHRAIIPGRPDEDPFTHWAFSRGDTSVAVRVPVGVVLHEGVGLGITAVGGTGVVRMYDIAARPFIENGTLEPILEDWSSERQPVHAITPEGRNIPAKVRAFTEFARSLVLPA